MSRRLAILTMSAAVLWTLICGCSLPTPPSDSSGRIAFVSNRDGNDEIYAMSASGSDLQRLTTNPADDDSPTWAPGGTRIAFTRRSSPTGFPEDVLYVMAVPEAGTTGSGEIQLTPGDPNNRVFNPAWSPPAVGARIAYQAGYVAPTHARFGIYVVAVPDGTDADGSGPVQLSEHGAYVQWSPDGTRIAYAAGTGELGEPRTGIYVVDAAGTGTARLLSSGGNDYRPVWSPDGSWIAFVSAAPGARAGLHMVDPNGTRLVQLTSSCSADFTPRWSPDGSTIAFVDRDAEGGEVIVLVEVTATHSTRLTSGHSPGWSPGGQRIAFVSDRDGDNEVYVVNRDGTGLIQLTNNVCDDRSPAWRP